MIDHSVVQVDGSSLEIFIPDLDDQILENCFIRSSHPALQFAEVNEF